MELSRRDFMKFSVPALCLPLVSKPQGSITSLAGGPALSVRTGGKAILYDGSKCNGCRACEVACRRANRLAPLPQQGPQLDLSPNSWTVVKTTEVVVNGKAEKAALRLQCLHCTDATCVKVCSTGTLRHNEVTGIVEFDRDKCNGCGYCVQECPFHVPRVSGTDASGQQQMFKCTMCSTRVNTNRRPVCVDVCPFHALSFGHREQMVNEGSDRVKNLRATYPDATLYGKDELGGLHVLRILKASPLAYGLPERPEVPAGATFWRGVVHPLGLGLGGLAVVGLAANYVFASQANKERKGETKEPESGGSHGN